MVRIFNLKKFESGSQIFEIFSDVLKEADGVIYQAVVFRHNVDHYEHFYKTDLENDCNHEAIKDPVLSFILKESKKYGNITEVCPLKLGHYQLRHFRIDSADLPNELPAGQYRFDFSAYIKRKDELHDIYTDKYYFTA